MEHLPGLGTKVQLEALDRELKLLNMAERTQYEALLSQERDKRAQEKRGRPETITAAERTGFIDEARRLVSEGGQGETGTIKYQSTTVGLPEFNVVPSKKRLNLHKPSVSGEQPWQKRKDIKTLED